MRDALRLLTRSPGFSAAAVGALALAIGANVTVFTLANAFLFNNLPFDDSSRVVYVSSTNAQRPGRTRLISYPDYLDLLAHVTEFDGAGLVATASVDLSDQTGLPEVYRSASLSAGAFAVIGQRPALGREFSAEDVRPGAAPVAIISDALWRGRYARDPAIAGRTIRINDVNTTVVGVMRPGVKFPGVSDVWLPLIVTPAMEQRRESRSLTMFARLAPGATVRSANAQIAVAAARLAQAYPATNKDIGALVQNFNDRFNAGDTPRLLIWLLWAVVFVLLIACANVANLLLARAVVRTREISIRASLGASRRRIIVQLLGESAVLAALAAAIGLALGVWGVRVFDAALVPAVKPAYIDFSIDARVYLYLTGITFVTALLFGLAPALQLSRLDINTLLKQGGSVAGRSRRARGLSGTLVIAEVALAVVLLAAAGLMIRSLRNTNRVDIGIDPANILSLNVNLRAATYPRPEDRVAFYDRLLERLHALPGVESAAVASDLPAESPDDFAYEIEGAAVVAARERSRAMGLIVGENYFRTMGVAPAGGREFVPADTAQAPHVAIVNATFAKAAWPQQSAVGNRLRFRLLDGAPGPWMTVVATVPDILQDDESFEVSPVIYVPLRQWPQGGMEILVRARVPPATLGAAIRREVQRLDGNLAVRTMRPLEESLWLRNWRYRVFGTMFTIFAAIALALASVGLYAVVAHSVSQRTREIGVRMTLGATAASIRGLVFREGLSRFAVGLVAGLTGAVAMSAVLESLLVGVTPADPITLAVAAAILAVACVMGCAVPARRAMRVDPIVALRME
jgi:predicted permease